MSQNIIQYSFNSGEWAPNLNARVDLAKYSAGAALLENFFVDYRGGASTRPGTKWVSQAYNSSGNVRLIPFQASVEVGYILEFGEQYIRFFYNGAPVLETGKAITGITRAANTSLTIPSHGFQTGDWVYVSGIVGTTELNGRYFSVVRSDVNTVVLQRILDSSSINSSAYTAWVSGGTVQRIYTIASPYSEEDLFDIKFVQEVNTLILCHPSYETQVLTLNTATDWTIAPVVIGATVDAPASVTVTSTLAGSAYNYSYAVCAVDASGQESAPTYGTLLNRQSLAITSGTNYITWPAVAGAVSYNVYRAVISVNAAPPSGAAHGYIGTVTGVQLNDSYTVADFSITPPVARNPFQGGSVLYATVGTAGTYTSVPTITFSASPAGVTATGRAVLHAESATVNNSGNNYAAGDIIYLNQGGIALVVATVSGSGAILTLEALTYPGTNKGAWTTGSTPSNPISVGATTGSGGGATINITWGVGSINITYGAYGYTSAPSITFSSGTATATATVSATDVGYPSVPAMYQQRLWLMGTQAAPQGFEASQPGAYYNFDTYNPVQSDSSISGSLISGQLNTIRAAVPMHAGMIVFSDRMNWLINGGAAGTGVGPDTITATPQTYIGISSVAPIVANADVLYVQAKGSIVRNASFNIYSNLYVGNDISIVSSHLFYGYTIVDWCWAEEPFKLVWAVRSDGEMLNLTYLKEHEFIAWAHSNTQGSFKSVASITENTADAGLVDAVYTVVERTINGTTVKYIERFAERIFPNGVEDAWCVDSGLEYSGAAATTFSYFDSLAGEAVVGLADGVPFTATVSTLGVFTLSTAASHVIVGLAFTPKLQTLALDLGAGQATVQGKVKKVNAVIVRAADTLGLKIGPDFNHLVTMKDFVIGNVSSMLTGQQTQQITDLVTGDAQTILSPAYTTPGQFCIQQDEPYPATILGVIPEITIGDGK